MLLREALDQAEAQLRPGPHADLARRDAETLLLHLTGKNRAWLLAHDDETLSADQPARYSELIARRFAGEPIQYITGEAEFYGLPFRVTPDVLIPRPETEHLVEKTLSLATQCSAPAAQPAPALPQTTGAPSILRTLQNGWETSTLNPGNRSCRILDIGTGSGAVAVALAHHLPAAHITAIDLSEAALAIATENAKRNGVSIRFLHGDLLAPVASEQFDLIVSNPPYVPATDRDILSVEVRDFEPSLALFAGTDGLQIYRRLIPQAFSGLYPGGHILLEIGYGQCDSVRALLADAGFINIDFTPDLQGILRVASARHPQATP